MKLSLTRRGVAAAVLAAVLLTTTAPALAVGNSRDVSDAMRYGPSAPLGEVIAEFEDQDDTTKTYAAPWPLNFFGVKYEGLCVTTNGGVYPVADSTVDCSNEYDMSLDNLALESDAPMIAVLAVDANTEACDPVRDAQRDGAGDGFGSPCSIYIDLDATIEGRDAVVVTWYRVSQYEDANDPTLENTYQLALIKLPTTDGATVGYDFDLEFNYGTITDGEDGYSAENPAEECESGTDDCRWGIGVASYDPGTAPADTPADSAPEATDPAVSDPPVTDSTSTDASDPVGVEPADEVPADTDAPVLEPATAESAVGYEFFAPTEVPNMMDNGATPLIANSLGTDVLGRYTCGMVSGQAVGCDPVTMRAPQLAETGLDESMTSVALTALVAAFSLVVVGAYLARRTRREVTVTHR